MNDNEKLTIKNVEVSDSVSDGIRISNVPYAHIESVTVRNSGGTGLVFDGAGHRPLNLAQELGIPENSIPLLLELLREVNAAPQVRRTEIVERSRLASLLAEKGLNVVAFMANLTTIASHPYVIRLLSNT